MFVRLDFKLKWVDYVGFRLGYMIEFMNFLILEDFCLVFCYVIFYGIVGFDKFGK